MWSSQHSVGACDASGRNSTSLLDIVIVNWNAGTQLQECVASLVQSSVTGFAWGRIVVVDNASTDGSADSLDSGGLPLVVIRNDSNRGFGAACNQGATHSKADYILFLNPDTRVYPETLAHSVAFMAAPENCKVGIHGVQLIDEQGRVSLSCARFPSSQTFIGSVFGLNRLFPSRYKHHFYTDWDHQDTRAVDQVMGAYFFVRRSLFERLRGFDEQFFVYFEEVDLSLRALQDGWRSMYDATNRSYHKGCGTTDQVKSLRLFYSVRSRLLYGIKHFSAWETAKLLCVTLVFEPFVRLAAAILRGSFSQMREVTSGFAKVYRALPEIMRRREPARQV
jgi:N-acetylglucosaminyl-diphospho-decaprenol L-rhamnosyltransferase